MNSFISIVIGFNIMVAPMPAMETKEVEATHPAKSINEIIQDQYPWQQDLLTSEILIPRMGKDVIEVDVVPEPHAFIGSSDSIEVESHSIIGDGFETHPCPQNYPGCMVVRWEDTEGKITTMCHFHKIKHIKE